MYICLHRLLIILFFTYGINLVVAIKKAHTVMTSYTTLSDMLKKNLC